MMGTMVREAGADGVQVEVLVATTVHRMLEPRLTRT
jgi:hypothetical protein